MAKLVAKTYSDALFEVGIENNSLEQFLEEFSFIEATFKEYPDFLELFKTPKISIEERKEAIQSVFGGKISSEMLNLLKIVLDKRRASEIFGIKDEFKVAVHKHNNVIEATVISAVPITEAQSERLVKSMAAVTGNDILIKNKVDETLIGGVVIYIGDKVIDGSVKKKLNELKEELAQIIV
ncbi:MAG: F0F1 ATP synthase subunit delta [Clostridia bacterium]|nr:F0F1 ATP synthase subunit delta [Clostridia bacterium]